MSSFFEFLKARGEPITGWSVGAVLAYFQHKRSELLTPCDIRVAKQNKLEDKSGQAGREIALYKFHIRAKKSPELPAYEMFRNRI